MVFDKIIRAWKDPEFRSSLSAEEQAQLPENPAGAIELSDEELDMATGGHGAYSAYHYYSNSNSNSNSRSSSSSSSASSNASSSASSRSSRTNSSSFSSNASSNSSNSNSNRPSNKSYRRPSYARPSSSWRR